MKINEFNKGVSYSYQQIENVVDKDTQSLSIEELGIEAIGEHFVIIKELNNGLVCSFVLISSSVNGYMYECIYNDWIR